MKAIVAYVKIPLPPSPERQPSPNSVSATLHTTPIPNLHHIADPSKMVACCCKQKPLHGWGAGAICIAGAKT